MKFYEFTYAEKSKNHTKVVDNKIIINGKAERLTKVSQLLKGGKIVEWNEGNTLYYEKGKVDLDYMPFYLDMTISKKLKQTLEVEGLLKDGVDVQFLPVKMVEKGNPNNTMEEYYILNILNKESNIINEKKSKKGVHVFYNFCFLRESNFHIFRIKGEEEAFFISEKFKNILERSEFKTDLEFYEIKVLGENEKDEDDLMQELKESYLSQRMDIDLLYNSSMIPHFMYSKGEYNSLLKIINHLQKTKDKQIIDLLKYKYHKKYYYYDKEEYDSMWQNFTDKLVYLITHLEKKVIVVDNKYYFKY